MDQDLVARAQHGDLAAFESMVVTTPASVLGHLDDGARHADPTGVHSAPCYHLRRS